MIRQMKSVCIFDESGDGGALEEWDSCFKSALVFDK